MPKGTGNHNDAQDGSPGVPDRETVEYLRDPAPSVYELNIERASELFDAELSSMPDLFCTRTQLPDGREITAPTHMMGQTEDGIRLIAYDDSWGPQQHDAARFIVPGEVVISIKHHSPHPDEGERMKLQCTHIQIAVGVSTAEGPGVITINNPQTYEASPFGSVTYPMIFVKPVFPIGVAPEVQWAYVDNIRTWLVIANTFTDFPGNYDGGDPLATRSVSQIRTLADNLLNALSGDDAALQWLASDENKVYCAELAHVALNLGLHCPLNRGSLGVERFEILARQIERRTFLSGNQNAYASLVTLVVAPEDLLPIGDLLGLQITEPHTEDPFGDGLAVEPFSLADILECFVRETVPRDQLGEDVAPTQAALLEEAIPALLQVTGMDQLSETDPKRMAVLGLYRDLIVAVGQTYADYGAFRDAIQPLMTQARRLVGPRANGAGAFIPPHCFLIRASDSIEGKQDQGVLNWQYLGHGLHASVLTSV